MQLILSPAQIEKIEKYLKKCFDRSRTWRKAQGIVEQAKEAYRFYRGIPYKKAFSYQSNYWKPMTMRVIETIVPRLIDGIFNSDEYFRYIAVDGNNQDAMDKLSKTVLWKQYYETDFLLRSIYALKNATVYGNVDLYYPWCYKRKFIRKNGARVEKILVDSPRLQYKPVWDVYPMPTANDEDMDWIIVREIVTKSALMARAKREGTNYILSQCKEVCDPGKNTFPSDGTEDIDELKSLLAVSSDKDTSDSVELLHYLGIYDLHSDTKNPEQNADYEVIMTIANRNTLVQAGDNPLDCQERMIQHLGVMPDTHGYYQIPIPQVGRDVQLEANDLTNLRLDNYAYMIHKMTKVKRNTDIAEKMGDGDVQLYPGCSLPVDEMDDIQEFSMRGPDSAAFAEQGRIDQDFDSANGVLDYTSGQPLGQQRTATGVSNVISESNRRYGLMMKTIQPVFRKMLHNWGMMTQQLVDPTTIMQFSPNDISNRKAISTQRVKKEEMQGDFYTILSATSMRGDKAYMFALLQNLKNIWAQDPSINQYELNRQIAESAELYNLDKLLMKVGTAVPPGEGQFMQGVAGGTPATDFSGAPANAASSLARELGASGINNTSKSPVSELQSIGEGVDRIVGKQVP